MPSDPYRDAVARLTALGPMRVWSLLVTVFGDLAPDAPLDGPILSAIMAEIGIKPEATRVALHRLRADGWIISEKSGRMSRHSLTAKGRADSDRARPVIYAMPPEDVPPVFALMAAGASPPDPLRFAAVSPRLYVACAGTTLPSGAAELTSSDLPDWFETVIETDELRASYAALSDALAALDTLDPAQLTPLEHAVLRVVIVHAWRRLALKHPMLPRAAHGPDWRGHDVRLQVMHLLEKLPRPALGTSQSA